MPAVTLTGNALWNNLDGLGRMRVLGIMFSSIGLGLLIGVYCMESA